MSIPDFVAAELKQLELDIEPAHLEQLDAYLTAMLDANKRFNLTGIREPNEAWRRHIIDSLTILPGLEALERGDEVVDVGTGGGLPGVPIAICRPDLSVTLMDSTGKKIRFLTEVTKQLGLTNIKAVQGRSEDLGQDTAYRERFDVSVCRAVGPMRELLEYTLPLTRVGGFLLAMKGPKVERELDEAGDALTTLGAGEVLLIDAYPEAFGIDTVIARVAKADPTPAAFPRLPGTPRREPL